MAKLVNISGQRFGKWLVVGEKPEPRKPSAKTVVRWKCLCDCGVFKDVEASSLKDGQSTNCGCSRKVLKHGGTGTPTYNSWNAMRWRCKNAPGYIGVTVQESWLGENGFLNFLADLGERPLGTTLDRRDGSKGYSADNCRWASPTTQTANRKNSRNVIFNGKVMPFSTAIARMTRRMQKGDRQYEIITLMPGSIANP